MGPTRAPRELVCSSSLDAPLPPGWPEESLNWRRRGDGLALGGSQWPGSPAPESVPLPTSGVGGPTRERARATAPPPRPPSSPPRHSPRPLWAPWWVGGSSHALSRVLPLPSGPPPPGACPALPGEARPPGPPSLWCRRPNPTDSIPAAGTEGSPNARAGQLWGCRL